MANGFRPVAKGFTNFDEYLSQNDPSKLVQSATGGLAQKAQGLQSEIGQAQTGFTQKALEGTGGVVSQATGTSGFATGAPKSEEEAQRMASAQYTGPRTLADAMGRDVTNEVGDIAGRVKGLQTAKGRMATLQEQNKGQTGYTRGMSAYDSALLGGSQQGAQAIKGLNEKYAGLNKFLGTAQQEAATTAAGVEGALQGAKPGAQAYLDTAQAQRETKARTEADIQSLKDQITTLNQRISGPYALPMDKQEMAAKREELLKEYNKLTGSGWATRR